tara:strand:+ start:66 stop:437 length:372 start_codon:yes stop_codon:yes gene_type:complete
MYDDSLVCTYHLLEEDATDELYRIQFLQVLGLEDWDDDKVDSEIDAIYAETSKAPWVTAAIARLRDGSSIGAWLAQLGSINDEMVFRLLFGYDYFHLTHRCISETHRIGSASDEARDALLNKL